MILLLNKIFLNFEKPRPGQVLYIPWAPRPQGFELELVLLPPAELDYIPAPTQSLANWVQVTSRKGTLSMYTWTSTSYYTIQVGLEFTTEDAFNDWFWFDFGLGSNDNTVSYTSMPFRLCRYKIDNWSWKNV